MSNQRLKSIVDRIVTLTEERSVIASNIADIYKEAKSNGDDVKALRIVIKRAMEDVDAKRNRENVELVAEKMRAELGMLFGTPLGVAAVSRS